MKERFMENGIEYDGGIGVSAGENERLVVFVQLVKAQALSLLVIEKLTRFLKLLYDFFSCLEGSFFLSVKKCVFLYHKESLIEYF